jgi:excisionase family DNA binding protein
VIQIPTMEEIRAEIRAVVRDELRQLRVASASTPTLLTVDEAAKQVGVHPRTIRRRIAAGELPVMRVGRCVRIDAAVLIPPHPMVERLVQLARAA